MSDKKTLTNEERENIKKEIINLIKKSESISFVQIEEIFSSFNFDYHGDDALCYTNYPTIIIWCGWNMDAHNIIKELLNNKIISFNPCNTIIYLIDGGAPTLPIAKKPYNYKKDHWLPMLICQGENFNIDK